MKTLFLGICEINNRQYFCGVWPTMEEVERSIASAYDIVPVTGSAFLASYHAVAVWEAIDNGKDGDELPESFAGHIAEEGFSIYEIPLSDLPGYMPFDED